MHPEPIHDPIAFNGADGDLERVLARNLEDVRRRMAHARTAAERDGTLSPHSTEPPELVAVTKSVSGTVALALHRLGALDLGENRANALLERAAEFERAGASARWHFIGPLQSNKIRRVVRIAHTIHSVDRMSLISRLDRAAREEDRKPTVYLEIKLSGEAEKHGFEPHEIDAAVDAVCSAEALNLAGFMTMARRPEAPTSEDTAGASNRNTSAASPCPARETFAALRGLAQAATERRPDAFPNERARLSMGMSGDFEQAIAEGADVVRVGRALFSGLEELSGPDSSRPTGEDRT